MQGRGRGIRKIPPVSHRKKSRMRSGREDMQEYGYRGRHTAILMVEAVSYIMMV